MVLDQKVETWLACHRRAFELFGGVPRRVRIDNAKCAITRACARDPEVQRGYAELAEGYDFTIDPCPPRDPKKKGRVEAGVRFLKRGFLPLRDFRDLADANRQLYEWVLGEAGNRLHGTTHQRPLTRFTESERILLQPLPDVAPEPAAWKKVKLHSDCHVRFEKNRYSAPYRLIGEELWLPATPTAVHLFQTHVLVATHPRLRGPGERSTVDDHLPPEALAFKRQDGRGAASGPSVSARTAEASARGVVFYWDRRRDAGGPSGRRPLWGQKARQEAKKARRQEDESRTWPAESR